MNKSNGVIATLPHEYSVLRSMFINKHLDEYGYIIEGKYQLKLKGFIIDYELKRDINYAIPQSEP